MPAIGRSKVVQLPVRLTPVEAELVRSVAAAMGTTYVDVMLCGAVAAGIDIRTSGGVPGRGLTPEARRVIRAVEGFAEESKMRVGRAGRSVLDAVTTATVAASAAQLQADVDRGDVEVSS